MKISFLKIGIGVFIVIAAGFALTLIPSRVSDKTIKGVQLRSAVWSGTIRIAGDTLFLPWTTLIIKPGTKILFDKQSDISGTDWTEFADAYIKDHNDPTGRVGYGKSHFDLVARIRAIGGKEQPIIFTSAQDRPEYADWDQLVLFGGSRLEFTEVSYAHNGVNINGKNAIIRNSKIHDSLWSCIDIFSTGNLIENNEIYHCWHQAAGGKTPGPNIIRNNNIHDAQLGVNCENGANPTIENNKLSAAPINPDCPKGAGNIIEERPRDVPGGTYNNQLIYPAIL